MTQKKIHQGRVIDLVIETVELPNGTTTDLEIIHHPGGAAVVAINDENKVCLIRQYRHAAGGWLWELPAGKIDPGEDPLITAKRELAEEAGQLTGKIEPLGNTLTTPGFCDEVIYLFRATELVDCPTQHEAHEVIEIHWLEFQQAMQHIREGIIRDAKTVIGLMLASL